MKAIVCLIFFHRSLFSLALFIFCFFPLLAQEKDDFKIAFFHSKTSNQYRNGQNRDYVKLQMQYTLPEFKYLDNDQKCNHPINKSRYRRLHFIDKGGKILFSTNNIPDGDGINNQLVFPELEVKNSLVIINRWGDIVFEASPYLNGDGIH